MRSSNLLRIIVGVVVVAAIAITLYTTQSKWIPLVASTDTADEEHDHEHDDHEHDEHDHDDHGESSDRLKISPEARSNLGLEVMPAELSRYWRKLQIPGEIVDRPGRSDRGVTSPAMGVVTQIHAFPGDTVKPGQQLFTLRLSSEYLQNTQKEFFSAVRETQLIEEEIERLQPLADRGGVAKSRIIELDLQVRRQAAIIQAHRQDLGVRGLSADQISRVEAGEFVTSIDISVPQRLPADDEMTMQQTTFRPAGDTTWEYAYEVQELHAELGQQVQAGQLLCKLADHSSLYIAGHAFKREAPFLELAARQGWDVQVEFVDDVPDAWPELDQSFQIRYLANTIDGESRTFDFFIPLTNQSRAYDKDGRMFLVWRFRPGQRVRLHVPVEELLDVIVLPADALVRDGPEAYVFAQDGDYFQRIAVRVLHEDRLNVVLANVGELYPGLFLAQNSGASLDRVLKEQSSSGQEADVHVHADGTVHANH